MVSVSHREDGVQLFQTECVRLLVAPARVPAKSSLQVKASTSARPIRNGMKLKPQLMSVSKAPSAAVLSIPIRWQTQRTRLPGLSAGIDEISIPESGTCQPTCHKIHYPRLLASIGLLKSKQVSFLFVELLHFSSTRLGPEQPEHPSSTYRRCH